MWLTLISSFKIRIIKPTSSLSSLSSLSSSSSSQLSFSLCNHIYGALLVVRPLLLVLLLLFSHAHSYYRNHNRGDRHHTTFGIFNTWLISFNVCIYIIFPSLIIWFDCRHFHVFQLSQTRDRARDARGDVKRRNSESTGIEVHTSQTSRHTMRERERQTERKSRFKNGLMNDKSKIRRNSQYIVYMYLYK